MVFWAGPRRVTYRVANKPNVLAKCGFESATLTRLLKPESTTPPQLSVPVVNNKLASFKCHSCHTVSGPGVWCIDQWLSSTGVELFPVRRSNGQQLLSSNRQNSRPNQDPVDSRPKASPAAESRQTTVSTQSATPAHTSRSILGRSCQKLLQYIFQIPDTKNRLRGVA